MIKNPMTEQNFKVEFQIEQSFKVESQIEQSIETKWNLTTRMINLN